MYGSGKRGSEAVALVYLTVWRSDLGLMSAVRATNANGNSAIPTMIQSCSPKDGKPPDATKTKSNGMEINNKDNTITDTGRLAYAPRHPVRI